MGKTRCPPCDCPQVLPLWLGTYGDMVTLILTFFILILSMVTFDAKKLTEAEGSMKGAMSLLSGGIKTEPDNTLEGNHKVGSEFFPFIRSLFKLTNALIGWQECQQLRFKRTWVVSRLNRHNPFND